ncbi:MAG TPA: hypothetical protein VEX68_27960 [Bryobacteraceae bacterium]|nr:hypothetical protein [Bryobacteraceae bacterium]
MKRFTVFAAGGIILAAALCAQDAAKSDHRDANIQAYIELLRQDVKKGKVAVLTEMMALTPEEASKFWPVYNEYDKELSRLGNERVALVKDYADNYGSMSDQKAVEIGRKSLDLESRRIALKKRYFDRISQSVSAKTAGRFLQIENQLLMIIDLQIASSLPIVD